MHCTVQILQVIDRIHLQAIVTLSLYLLPSVRFYFCERLETLLPRSIWPHLPNARAYYIQHSRWCTTPSCTPQATDLTLLQDIEHRTTSHDFPPAFDSNGYPIKSLGWHHTSNRQLPDRSFATLPSATPGQAAMTLAELAGRLLKGSGHSQFHPGAGPYSETRPSLERVNGSSFAAPPGSNGMRGVSGGGMVGSSSGEPRVSSLYAPSWAKARPLSDIRELTEPSLAETIPRRLLSDNNLPRSTSRVEVSRRPSAASRCRPGTDTRHGENRDLDRKNSVDSNRGRSVHRVQSSRTPSPDNNSVSSLYSIPPGSVPLRSSSCTRARSGSRTRQTPAAQQAAMAQQPTANTATHTLPIVPQPAPRAAGHTVPRHGQSLSPLRYVATRIDQNLHNKNRRTPSRTFIREPFSQELLEFPSHRHPRIELGLDLSASIFVGGGSIEGTVQINIDDAERIRHRRTLDIARMSIDLLGIEEMNGNRRCIFLNLATELIDEDHPPPLHMVYDQKPISSRDLFWHLMPSFTNLAFNLSLPLNVGPPPFHSKNARIRYALCVSLLIRDHGKQYIVRTSDDVTVLSVYDRESCLDSAIPETLICLQLKRLSCHCQVHSLPQTNGSKLVTLP